MTGLERLQELVDDMGEWSVFTVMKRDWCERHGVTVIDGRMAMKDLLSEIVDQIERETAHDPSKDVSMSAYDLLPDDEQRAIAWVREHGGLGAVKASVHQGAMEHGCLLKIAEMLGTSIYDGSDNADALLAKISERLMPEGMKWLLEVWPKWSNGEYCKFGDWWTADKYGDYEPRQLRRLVFYTPEQLREWEQDEGDNFGYEWDFMRPSDTTYRPDKVEPPAPKVLDADGVEIRVGDTLYYVDGREQRVNTVARLTDSGRVQFGTINEAGYVTYCDAACIPPNQLTHERPESWERLEEDAGKNPFDYCKDVGHRLDTCENSEAYKARDLVRRAKKLAGVS